MSAVLLDRLGIEPVSPEQLVNAPAIDVSAVLFDRLGIEPVSPEQFSKEKVFSPVKLVIPHVIVFSIGLESPPGLKEKDVTLLQSVQVT